MVLNNNGVPVPVPNVPLMSAAAIQRMTRSPSPDRVANMETERKARGPPGAPRKQRNA